MTSNTARKTNQKELVSYSVKAQDIIQKYTGFKTTDDLNPISVFRVNNHSASLGIAGMTNITTNISQQQHGAINEENSKITQLLNRSVVQENADQLFLPSIKQEKGRSPIKASPLDLSATQQKLMRQTQFNDNPSQFNLTQGGFKTSKNKDNSFIGSIFKDDLLRGSKSIERQGRSGAASLKMNPKVLETWINETLQDAEHLDIPGVLLKPEHKNPISRYGIDRLALTNAGIPNEMVDRIFRALFVYSVGFYELIKKCLQHTDGKYTIITAIWKVFSILLEYCCKTDYRMLVGEISKEHKEELDKIEKEYQVKFQEQAHNEKVLKQNMEILQKYNEELEKERTNERQMRLKLEEEYMQNTKNHEEEVQLRLKFESKLNNMHSVHRDLESKYKRALNELAGLQNTNEQLTNKNNALQEEITILKTVKAEQDSKLSYNEEKLNALQREINIKMKQVDDYELRYVKTQEELDLIKYKLQEAYKDVTELKLRNDVLDSQLTGTRNEKQHLELELKETKDLQKVYEKKCGELMMEVNKTNLEFQKSKREIIGYGEISKEREERIDKLKSELNELKTLYDALDIKHGTLVIQNEKVKEQYEICKKDLEDAIEKLHVTNKVRHETEVKLNEEADKTKLLSDMVKDRDDSLVKKSNEIEELDRKIVDLERMNEALEIKKNGIERQYELTKKQLNEKVQNLNDVLTSEKETREMWIERYEKEQREHTTTNAQLLQTKSSLKDQILLTKNAEIKLQTMTKANEVLQESNMRLQETLNETIAKSENLEREINTQKEITKQMDGQRKEYIQKLKKDLETVESRYNIIVERVEMMSEDYYSRAAENLLNFQVAKVNYYESSDQLKATQVKLEQKNMDYQVLEVEMRETQMQYEEYLTRLVDAVEEKTKLKQALHSQYEKNQELLQEVHQFKNDAEMKVKVEEDYEDLLDNFKKQSKELIMLKAKNQELVNQMEVVKQDAMTQTIGQFMAGNNNTSNRQGPAGRGTGRGSQALRSQISGSNINGQGTDQMNSKSNIHGQSQDDSQSRGGGQNSYAQGQVIRGRGRGRGKRTNQQSPQQQDQSLMEPSQMNSQMAGSSSHNSSFIQQQTPEGGIKHSLNNNNIGKQNNTENTEGRPQYRAEVGAASMNTRVGGGGQIRRPERLRNRTNNNNQQQQQQNEQFVVGGHQPGSTHSSNSIAFSKGVVGGEGDQPYGDYNQNQIGQDHYLHVNKNSDGQRDPQRHAVSDLGNKQKRLKKEQKHSGDIHSEEGRDGEHSAMSVNVDGVQNNSEINSRMQTQQRVKQNNGRGQGNNRGVNDIDNEQYSGDQYYQEDNEQQDNYEEGESNNNQNQPSYLELNNYDSFQIQQLAFPQTSTNQKKQFNMTSPLNTQQQKGIKSGRIDTNMTSPRGGMGHYTENQETMVSNNNKHSPRQVNNYVQPNSQGIYSGEDGQTMSSLLMSPQTTLNNTNLMSNLNLQQKAGRQIAGSNKRNQKNRGKKIRRNNYNEGDGDQDIEDEQNSNDQDIDDDYGDEQQNNNEYGYEVPNAFATHDGSEMTESQRRLLANGNIIFRGGDHDIIEEQEEDEERKTHTAQSHSHQSSSIRGGDMTMQRGASGSSRGTVMLRQSQTNAVEYVGMNTVMTTSLQQQQQRYKKDKNGQVARDDNVQGPYSQNPSQLTQLISQSHNQKYPQQQYSTKDLMPSQSSEGTEQILVGVSSDNSKQHPKQKLSIGGGGASSHQQRVFASQKQSKIERSQQVSEIPGDLTSHQLSQMNQFQENYQEESEDGLMEHNADEMPTLDRSIYNQQNNQNKHRSGQQQNTQYHTVDNRVVQNNFGNNIQGPSNGVTPMGMNPNYYTQAGCNPVGQFNQRGPNSQHMGLNLPGAQQYMLPNGQQYMMMSPGGGNFQSSIMSGNQNDRKVNGKSTIRTLIKSAATRDQ